MISKDRILYEPLTKILDLGQSVKNYVKMILAHEAINIGSLGELGLLQKK